MNGTRHTKSFYSQLNYSKLLVRIMIGKPISSLSLTFSFTGLFPAINLSVLRIETYLSLTLIIASRNMRAAMYLAFSVISLLMGFYFGHGRAQLSDTFYAQTCPNLESTVTQAVTAKTQETFVAIPATLRLFFHDCFVEVKKK